MRDCIIEICCADIESVEAAKEGGADRIELCAALEIGGLTPSSGLISEAVRIMGGERVNVLIRPRGGDFVYSCSEFRVMEADIAEAVALGAGGIVMGALTPCGEPDLRLLEEIRRRFPEVTFTFHRAFDLSADPFESAKAIRAAGFDRILTSGLAPTALEGAQTIRRLVEEAGGAIEIMAGSGVTPENLTELISLTGVRAVHASAKMKRQSQCSGRGKGISMGSRDGDDYTRMVTSAETVKELISK